MEEPNPVFVSFRENAQFTKLMDPFSSPKTRYVKIRLDIPGKWCYDVSQVENYKEGLIVYLNALEEYQDYEFLFDQDILMIRKR